MFSIIVVCLNPGEGLNETLESILGQTCRDFEVIVKDGGSSDGSVEQMRRDHRIRLYMEKDSSIYDAMNQAVSHAKGEFILFMNCGDLFAREDVLAEIRKQIEELRAAGTQMEKVVLYGDTYGRKNQVPIVAPPQINGFACYRNIPCHQSCIYATALCKEKAYDLSYSIRADYDHFLWCFYKAKARMQYLGFTVASYEGGGFSESRENAKRDQREHREITRKYMSAGELFRYRMLLALTLAPLRRRLAESRSFSGIYHWLKERVYHRGE